MDLVTLAQLILLILQYKNIKPKKHNLKNIAQTLAQYILGIPINQLPLPKSTTYYYINKLKVKKRRRKERTTTQTVTCPKCKLNNVIKNGSSRGKKKYKCKSCNSTFYQGKFHKLSKDEKRMIIQMYTHNMSMRSISEILVRVSGMRIIQ